MTDVSDARTLYEEDFVAWSKQQAEALRAAARTGSNQRLDWENLAEEVEDLGRSVRRGLRSQLTRIIHHLLKLQFSPAENRRRGWKSSVREARSEVAALLNENRSLRSELPRFAGEQSAEGAKLAAGDLEDHGELKPPISAEHLIAASYSIDQILGDWFPPEPAPAPRRGGG
ncbi:MAG TPA: DUF29 domain-containing protein [Stellaceae bacterium]|jgi:hypothetical protein